MTAKEKDERSNSADYETAMQNTKKTFSKSTQNNEDNYVLANQEKIDIESYDHSRSLTQDDKRKCINGTDKKTSGDGSAIDTFLKDSKRSSS